MAGESIDLSCDQKSYPEDRISNLSDDLLAFILSFLTVREAVGTSFLGKRWRYVWICISSLNFDDSGTLNDEIRDNKVLLAQSRTKYVNWVNRVLAMHNGPSVSQFRLCFDLDKSFESTTHEWLKFALSKRIQSLELDVSGGHVRDDYSSFPDSIFYQRERFVGFQSLESLRFHSVIVTGKIVESFLSCCPLLERVSIGWSCTFGSLRIVRPSTTLKYLELFSLFGSTGTFEICDSNLVCLKYTGAKINLLLKNVPYLAEVHIGGGICRDLNDVFSKLSCCLSQLEVLSLGLHHMDIIEELKKLDKVPNLPKLKHLTLKIQAWKDASLLRFTTLLKGSPHLEQLVLELEWTDDTGRLRLRKKMKFLKCCGYQHLKVLEFRGYYGRISDLEFVMHFTKNAVVLEKIIIDPRSAWNFDKEKERIAKSFAVQQLQGIEPVGVELVIL